MGERTRFHGALLEEVDGLSYPFFGAAWDHVPCPPFKVQRWPLGETQHPSMNVWQVSSSQAFIMGAFVAWTRQDKDTACVILDESFSVVLGWTHWNGIVEWHGVGFGFDWMREAGALNERDLFIAENDARMKAREAT